MKKRFTFLIAAFAAIMLITSPLVGKGQVAPVNTELWKETWTGGTTDENPSAYEFEGTTVYGGVTLTYAQSNSDTKIKNENLAGGTAPELLLKKGNTTWTISNIPTGKATEMSLTFKSNKTAFSVTSGTTGITISGSGKSWTISATSSVSNFELVIKNTSSSDNARVDDVLLKVTTASTVPTITITTPLNLAPNAVADGVMTASYSSITPTSGSVTLWNNSACTEEFTGDATGLWLTADFGTKATDFEKINYTVTENNTGSVRTAYMKVAVSGTSKVEANKVVTITQNTFHTVTFHGHGGLFEESGTYTQKIPNSVATPLELNKFVKEGSYFFKEWTTDEEGVEDSYEDGEEVTLTDDLDLYAQWDEGYTVSLNSNGVITNKGVKKGESLTLTAPNNVPSGFKFQGWTATPGTPSSLETSPYTPAGNITLYASFKKINSLSYDKISSLSNVTAGEYIITAYNSSTYYTFSNAQLTSGAMVATTQTVDGDAITGNVSSITWTFSGTKTSSMTITSTANDSYYLNVISDSKGLRVNTTSDTWAITNGGATGTFYLQDENQSRYLAYYVSGTTKEFRTYTTTSNGAPNLTLFKKTENLSSEYYVRAFDSDAAATDDITIVGPTVIESGTVLNMGSYDLTNTTAANLIIEDGGQLILAKTNTGVAATVKKDVSAATAASKTDATYWYAISAGVENPLISSNTNLITESGGDPTYDLYRFNEAKNAGNAWENYRNSDYSATFTTLEKGRGYLYRNASDLTIAMTGDINVEDFTYNVTKTGSGEYAGFNLIGNPYTHDIYKGAGTAITSGTSTLSTGFYYLEPSTGKWAKGTDNSTAIAPNQGILVQVNTTGNINMANTNSNGSAKSNNDYIMLSVANSQYSDEAYAWFDKGIGLNKIEHRNSEIPMLYINQNDENFAIATMSDETQSFNLNFKAATMGKYTLSYETKGEYSYLHVIDRLTGEDVDMLMDGEYSFIASPIDSENRFIVRLEYSAGSEISESSIFAYQSGSDIIVNGEGELQIFDVMGRRILTQYVSGVETINLQLNGVFIFKLNEKTQKIVVR